jgi:hypothetical protein
MKMALRGGSLQQHSIDAPPSGYAADTAPSIQAVSFVVEGCGIDGLLALLALHDIARCVVRVAARFTGKLASIARRSLIAAAPLVGAMLRCNVALRAEQTGLAALPTLASLALGAAIVEISDDARYALRDTRRLLYFNLMSCAPLRVPLLTELWLKRVLDDSSDYKASIVDALLQRRRFDLAFKVAWSARHDANAIGRIANLMRVLEREVSVCDDSHRAQSVAVVHR